MKRHNGVTVREVVVGWVVEFDDNLPVLQYGDDDYESLVKSVLKNEEGCFALLSGSIETMLWEARSFWHFMVYALQKEKFNPVFDASLSRFDDFDHQETALNIYGAMVRLKLAK